VASKAATKQHLKLPLWRVAVKSPDIAAGKWVGCPLMDLFRLAGRGQLINFACTYTMNKLVSAY